ncbi:MAG: zinc ribbon domain-containing protein [Ramlibacter sp.]|nr:zinc ribbon domain-containing protein [Ramlibacter sp.]
MTAKPTSSTMQLHCPECGAEVAVNAVTCANCLSRLDGPRSPVSTPPATAARATGFDVWLIWAIAAGSNAVLTMGLAALASVFTAAGMATANSGQINLMLAYAVVVTGIATGLPLWLSFCLVRRGKIILGIGVGLLPLPLLMGIDYLVRLLRS